jgi:hypothetical protein
MAKVRLTATGAVMAIAIDLHGKVQAIGPTVAAAPCKPLGALTPLLPSARLGSATYAIGLTQISLRDCTRISLRDCPHRRCVRR